MKFKNLFLILIIAVFSAIMFIQSEVEGITIPNCSCGIYRAPMEIPYIWDPENYIELVSTMEDFGTTDYCFNLTCRDEFGNLIEFCRENGKYYTYITCDTPIYMTYDSLSCMGDESEDVCDFKTNEGDPSAKILTNFFLEEVDLDKDFDDCSFVLNGDLANFPKVSVVQGTADQGNDCCGDDIPDDLGYMANASRFVCIDKTNTTNQYHWLGANQNWFKIFTMDRSKTENPVVYDIVSNTLDWFVCEPGEVIEGPSYTVEIIPRDEILRGATRLMFGVEELMSTTLGTTPSLPPPSPGAATEGSATNFVDIMQFGSDFSLVENLTITSETDKDKDGYIDMNIGGDDCNDLDPTIYFGAYDPCGDGINQDCDIGAGGDGDLCVRPEVTFLIPDLAERFTCFNEEKKGIFAECCGADMSNCYNEIPKGRRQGAVTTTIEEFQEGCDRKANCVLQYGLVPLWGGPYYSYDIDISKTDFEIRNWTSYENLEFFIYLSDDFVQDIIILGKKIKGAGEEITDYETLFYQPITKYVVNTVSLGKWMHVVIPIDDPNWIDPPDYVNHILFYADKAAVQKAGGKTKASVAGGVETAWENIIGIDRIFLRPKTNIQYCTGTNKPTWIKDLDNETKDDYGNEYGRVACQVTPTYGWTGSKCCGDDTTQDEHEYFSDSLAGCWKGNTVPSDSTAMNVEYELTYNTFAYEKTYTEVPVAYEIEDFEYLIHYLRWDWLYNIYYSDYIDDFNLSTDPKNLGPISDYPLPDIRWQTSEKSYKNAGSDRQQFFCPKGEVAIGTKTFKESGSTAAVQGIYCAPMDGITVKFNPRRVFLLADGSSYCPAGEVVCGGRGAKYEADIMNNFYCCDLIGATIDMSNPNRLGIGTSGDTKFCEEDEVICGFEGGQTYSDDYCEEEPLGCISIYRSAEGIYCCPLVDQLYQYIVSDENENIDTYFESADPSSWPWINYYPDFDLTDEDIITTTKETTDIIAAAKYDRIKDPGGEVFFVGEPTYKQETKTFTQICKSDECVYPLVGYPPYSINNPHPGLYNITIDENRSLLRVTKIRQEVIFWNGTFYGCNASDYIMNIDDDLTINNSPEMCDIIGTHFCSPNKGWNNELEGAPNASSRNTVKATPEEYPEQSRSCCPEDWCWNSTECIPSEAGVAGLVNPIELGDKVWRCLYGNWSLSIKRYTWDYNQSGFCPSISQCLVDPFGNSSLNNQPWMYNPAAGVPQCIEDGQYIEDHYCFNGTWTSRTKQIAVQMLNIVNETGDMDNYTLFCDNYTNALANYDYLAIEDYLRGKVFAMPPISIITCAASNNYVMPCVNNFCVMKYTDRSSGDYKVVFGTSLNRDVDDSEFSFMKTLDEATNYCSDLIGTNSDFTECKGDENIWYSDSLNSVIFSRTGVEVGDLNIFEGFVRFVSHPITSIINFVVDIIAPRAEPSGALIDYNFTKNVKDFNRIYINRLYDISIKAIIEEPQKDEKFITINYTGVPEDICLAVDTYDKANPPDGQISCKKEGDAYYVISDQEVAFKVWTDFTSKLRPVYSP